MKFPLILKAENRDLPILNSISVAAKSYWKYPQEWISSWMEELTLKECDLLNQEVWKLCDDQGIAGFCAIQENEDNYEINHFWMKPEAMGKGYGKRLLQFILDQVTIRSKPVVVISDPHAESFYKRFGFITTDQVESFPKGRYLPVMLLMKGAH